MWFWCWVKGNTLMLVYLFPQHPNSHSRYLLGRSSGVRCSSKWRDTSWTPLALPAVVGGCPSSLTDTISLWCFGCWHCSWGLRISTSMMEASEAFWAPGILSTLAEFFFLSIMLACQPHHPKPVKQSSRLAAPLDAANLIEGMAGWFGHFQLLVNDFLSRGTRRHLRAGVYACGHAGPAWPMNIHELAETGRVKSGRRKSALFSNQSWENSF